MALSVGLVLAGVVSCASRADFVRYVVTAIDVEHEGENGSTPLTVYTLSARFDGPKDAVILAFRLKSDKPDNFTGFWHKDALSAPSEDELPALSQTRGTWSPAQVLRPKQNRPFDSYLTIGGLAMTANGTIADPSWSKAPATAPDGTPDTRGWSRADLPANGITGWYAVAAPANTPGRVGTSPQDEINGKPTLENPATDVRLAQFVLSRGHAPREFTLTVAFSDGTEGKPQEYATGTFVLGASPATNSVTAPPAAVPSPSTDQPANKSDLPQTPSGNG
jgi:hypothetical protein